MKIITLSLRFLVQASTWHWDRREREKEKHLKEIRFPSKAFSVEMCVYWLRRRFVTQDDVKFAFKPCPQSRRCKIHLTKDIFVFFPTSETEGKIDDCGKVAVLVGDDFSQFSMLSCLSQTCFRDTTLTSKRKQPISKLFVLITKAEKGGGRWKASHPGWKSEMFMKILRVTIMIAKYVSSRKKQATEIFHWNSVERHILSGI